MVVASSLPLLSVPELDPVPAIEPDPELTHWRRAGQLDEPRGRGRCPHYSRTLLCDAPRDRSETRLLRPSRTKHLIAAVLRVAHLPVPRRVTTRPGRLARLMGYTPTPTTPFAEELIRLASPWGSYRSCTMMDPPSLHGRRIGCKPGADDL